MIFGNLDTPDKTVTENGSVIIRCAIIFAFWSLAMAYILSNSAATNGVEQSESVKVDNAGVTWRFALPEVPGTNVLANLEPEYFAQLKIDSQVMNGSWQPAEQTLKTAVVDSERKIAGSFDHVSTMPIKSTSEGKPARETHSASEPNDIGIGAHASEDARGYPLAKSANGTGFKSLGLSVQNGVTAQNSQTPAQRHDLVRQSQPGVKTAARLLISSQRYQAASTLLVENLPDIHSDSEHFALLAVAMLGEGEFLAAMEMYTSLLRLKPKNPQWWAGYALSLEKMGDLESVTLAYEALHQITYEGSQLRMLARQKLKQFRRA
ncbi:MAG: hypothetical protein KUG75_13310 [Pseudomonadales bacterium]|nr:hypothetical protein [Pseudomonadales bacterium]